MEQNDKQTLGGRHRRRPRLAAALGLCLATLIPLALPAAAAAQTKAFQAGVADIRKLGDAFALVAEKVSPSVVQIEVVAGNDTDSPLRWLREDGVRRGMGSGVIFSSDGAILTNNHVIEEARSINVRLRDGRMFPASLVGRDPATDLAVVRIDAKNLPAAVFADSDAAKVGEWVLAIGSPFGLGHTVTTGVLSAKGRGAVGVNAVEDYLQTDASINPGNSGGPLINLDGQVLGINTMIVSRGQGIGLAVPARMARRVAEQILKKGHVERAWMGVGIQDLTPQIAGELQNPPPSGALVNSVALNSPSAKANLEPGDVIAALMGRPVSDAQDVIREVFLHDVGEVIPIEVVRKGKRYQTKITLESRGDPPPPSIPIEQQAPTRPGLGLSLRNVPDGRVQVAGAPRNLAQIVAVSTSSAADRAGLRAGDLVLEADGTRDPSAEAVQNAAKDGHMLLRILRQDATFYAAVQ